MPLHIIKLVVGCDSIEDLLDWRKAHPSADWRVHTRQTPKRAAEVLDGGSIYRVFRGLILCRQEILGIETLGDGKAARCHIVVSPEIVRVAPTPRRAFQGWRYLRADEAPPDLDSAEAGALPSELAARLREAGAW
jgi:hypothetical protein